VTTLLSTPEGQPVPPSDPPRVCPCCNLLQVESNFEFGGERQQACRSCLLKNPRATSARRAMSPAARARIRDPRWEKE